MSGLGSTWFVRILAGGSHVAGGSDDACNGRELHRVERAEERLGSKSRAKAGDR